MGSYTRLEIDDYIIILAKKLSNMQKIKIENHTFSGGLWVGAWLFTIGFLHLTFWQGVLAVVIWPYYLGVATSLLVH